MARVIAIFAVLSIICVHVDLFGSTYGLPIPAHIFGRYDQLSDPADPTFNDYLAAMGMHEAFRLVLAKIKLNLEVQQGPNDTYKIKIMTGLLNRETTFKFGEEQRGKYVDGRNYMTTFTMEDKDTIRQDLTFEDGNEALHRYKFDTEGLTATLSSKDKVTVQKYKRVSIGNNGGIAIK